MFVFLLLFACNGDSTDDTSADVERPPVADAGSDQSVVRLGAVALDASGSSDPDDDSLTFAWTQLEGASVTLSDAASSEPMFVAPDVPGALVFEVEVSDGTTESATDEVVVDVVNQAPTADAGADQSVDREVLVTLDGTGSGDPDFDTLTWAWTQTAGPSVTLSDDTASQPTFTTPDAAGVLTFSLVVDDGYDASAADTVDVAIDNTTPVASAGLDQSVDKGQLVTLSSAGSTDGDGDDLTSSWTQTAGTSVVLSDDTATQPTFTAPAVSGTLTFQVVVNDGYDDSAPDSVDVTVVNKLPFADAGDDQTVSFGDFVTLDGTDSFDLDPTDTLTYAWTQEAGTAVTLSDDTADQPTFTAPSTGDVLRFRLFVDDGEASSLTGSVVEVTVQNLPPVADAGPDQNAPRDSLVTLDGTASYDPDGVGVTSWAWSQVAGPVDVVLSDDTAAEPTFTTPANVGGTFVFELVVSDGEDDSIPDRTRVSTPSAPPVADAGVDATYNGGEFVFLDGRGSSDPEGDPLLYRWEQISGTPVDLGDGDRARAYFAVPAVADEVLTFSLTVSDGQSQDSDGVAITAIAWDGDPVVLPPNPWAITWVPTPNNVWSITAAGDSMVVSGNDLGGDDLLLFDINDPFDPLLLDSTEPPANSDVFLYGDVLYMDGADGLDVYSIAGDAFSYQTTVDLTGDWDYPGDFSIDGNLMFVRVVDNVAGVLGVLVMDISTPTAPVIILDQVADAHSLTTRPGELWVHGLWTMVGYDTTGLGSPPNLLVQLTDASDPACGFVAMDMTIVGDTLLAACESTGLVAFDISDPTEPEITATTSEPGYALRVVVDGNTAYVSADDAGVHEYDVTDPSDPVYLGSHAASGNTEQLVVANGAVFVHINGKQIDIMEPGVSAPEYAVDYPIDNLGWRMAYDAGHVAVGMGGETELIDVSDPGDPVRASIVAHGGQGDVLLAWPWLFASGGQGLAIADVVVPGDPLIVYTLTAGDRYEQLFLDGDTLFAAQRTDGLQAYDVSNRNQPDLLDTFGAGNDFRGVAVRDDVVFAGAANDAIYSLDASDPTDVQQLDAVTYPGAGNSFETSGNYLYDGFNGLEFVRFDVTDPSDVAGPVYFDLGLGDPLDLQVNGALAWLALGAGGVAVADVSDPANPVVVERYAAVDRARGVALGPDHAWVADGDVVHAVRLDNARWTTRHDLVPTSSVSTWSAAWSEPTVGAEAKCFVEAGSCMVTAFDDVNRTADVEWTLPSVDGDYEIALVIGHSTTHTILRDRVSAAP